IDNPLIKMLLTLKPIRPITRTIKNIYEKITGRKIALKFYDVDHRRSIAFATSSTSFAVIVKSYEQIDEIISVIKNVKGIKGAFKREDIFNGPFLKSLPEIFVVPDFDSGYYLGTNKVSYEVVKKRRILNHHPLGVYIMKKWEYDNRFPDIIPNYMVANIIMNELDVPLSSWADGVNEIRKLVEKQPRLTDLYVKRWKLIKRAKAISL
ncbi:MAG: phosphodiesterase, partial [Thermoprotei archaeon]